MIRKSIFYATLFTLLSACETVENGPSLVPEEPANAPNYWCTWYAQNYWQQRGGEIKDFNQINNPNAREEVNYENIFDPEEGWATTYLPKGRSDFYFLIDHGWQTKDKDKRIEGAQPFFSLQIDEADFPEYANTQPEEALRLFNEEIQANGWKGLGIWVRGNIPEETARKFVNWSKYAGITYWKIDGGDTQDFYAYKAKQELFPALVLEYVTPVGNLNPNWDKPGQRSYPSAYAADSVCREHTRRVLRNSDVFRTYDATPQLMSATTLRRTHDLLKLASNNPEYVSVLNLQDDCNAAAALGCLVASKRHPNFNERLYKGKDLHHQLNGKRHMQSRINEVERFGRWERIAPAFQVGRGTYVYSEKELVDYCSFDEYSTWNKATYGKTVYQSAPAIMARNLPLPRVEAEGEPPYVMATKYPNGSVCIATEGRVRPEDEWFYPRARVTVELDELVGKIGVFGYYKELVLVCPEDLSAVRHIWAQDLLADSSVDIKEKVQIKGNRLIIPGSLIQEIGLSAADDGDTSAPGMVIRIEC